MRVSRRLIPLAVAAGAALGVLAGLEVWRWLGGAG